MLHCISWRMFEKEGTQLAIEIFFFAFDFFPATQSGIKVCFIGTLRDIKGRVNFSEFYGATWRGSLFPSLGLTRPGIDFDPFTQCGHTHLGPTGRGGYPHRWCSRGYLFRYMVMGSDDYSLLEVFTF